MNEPRDNPLFHLIHTPDGQPTITIEQPEDNHIFEGEELDSNYSIRADINSTAGPDVNHVSFLIYQDNDSSQVVYFPAAPGEPTFSYTGMVGEYDTAWNSIVVSDGNTTGVQPYQVAGDSLGHDKFIYQQKFGELNLPSGEHTLVVRVTDVNGNITSSNRRFTIRNYPVVTSTDPNNGKVSVVLDSAININFDHEMETAATQAAISISPALEAPTYTWSNANKTLTIDDAYELDENQSYTVTVADSAKDKDGNQLDGDKDGQAGGSYTFSFSTTKVTYNITSFSDDCSGCSERWVKSGTKTLTIQVDAENGGTVQTKTAPKITSSAGPITFSTIGPSSVWTGSITISGGDGPASFTSTDDVSITGITQFMIDTTPPTASYNLFNPSSNPSCPCGTGPLSFDIQITDSGSGVEGYEPVGLGISASVCKPGGNSYRYGATHLKDRAGNESVSGLTGEIYIPMSPGCDHGDDNVSVSAMSVSGTDPDEPAGQIAVYQNGYPLEFGLLMAKVNKNILPVIDQNSSGMVLNPKQILAIPSGGLYGMERSAILKTQLDDFVSRGGTLVVFGQQHGYEYAALPVPRDPDGVTRPVYGGGWQEDISCFINSTYIDNWHQMLAGQGRSTPSINLDGYLSQYPASSTVLLRRVLNDMPEIIMYEYGLGRVIVSSLYTDWAYSHSMASKEDLALVRDIMSWAVKPAQLPETIPGGTVSFELTSTNTSTTSASSVKLTFLNPDRKVVSEQVLSLSLASGQTASVPVSYATTSVSPLGIWWVDYTLLDSATVVQAQTQTTSGRFAVSNPLVNPYKSSEFSFSIQSDAERYLYGSPALFTVTAVNDSDAERTVSFRYQLPRIGPDGSKTFTFSAKSTASFTIAVPHLANSGELAGGFYDESGNRLGYARKGVNLIALEAEFSMEPSKAIRKGETLTLSTAISTSLQDTWPTTVKITIMDPQNRIVQERTHVVKFSSSSPSATIPTTYVSSDASIVGTYSVRAEAWFGPMLVGAAATSFDVTGSTISLKRIKKGIVQGANTIDIELYNAGRTDVFSGSLALNLKTPDNVSLTGNSQEFTLRVGEVKTLSFPIELPPLVFGVYTLTCLQTDETKPAVTTTWFLKNEVWLGPVVGTRTTAAGKLTEVGAGGYFINLGEFTIENAAITVSVPDIPYSETIPGQQVLWEHHSATPIAWVPRSAPGGPHDVDLAFALPSGSTTTAKTEITVPRPSWKLDILAPNEPKGGDAVTFSATNSSWMDKTVSGGMYVIDFQWNALVWIDINDTIPAGETRQYGLDLPAQIATGAHEVYGYLFDSSDGSFYELTRWITVSGVQADLFVKTDKDMYLSTELPGALGTIVNKAVGIENGNLHLRILDKCDLSGFPWEDRYVACSESVLWEADIPRNVAAGASVDWSQVVGSLLPCSNTYPASMDGTNKPSYTCQYHLQGKLTTETGETLSQAEAPFTISDGDIGLTFRTDKAVYRAGEVATITGEVKNFSGVDAPGLVVNISAVPELAYSETMDLPAGGSRTFSFTRTFDPAEAESRDVSFQLTGEVMQNNVVLAATRGTVEAAEAIWYYWSEVPPVVGSTPFAISVYLFNEGKVPGTATVTISGGSLSETQTLTVPPGKEGRATFTHTITEDTTYIIETIGGSYLNQRDQYLVTYGNKADILLNPRQVSPEGPTFVPVTVSNTGLLDETLVVNYQLLQGSTAISQETRTYSILTGKNKTDTRVYDLVEGDYTILASSVTPSASTQAAFSVRKETSLQMIAALGAQSSGRFPVTAVVSNPGLNTFDGSVQVSVLDGQENAVWEAVQAVSRLGYQNSASFAFSVDPSSMTPNDYIIRVRLFDHASQQLVEQTLLLQLRSAAYQITKLPDYQTIASGQTGTFLFTVKNTGNQEGTAELKFQSYDLIDSTAREWLKPGEEKDILFTLLVPADLEEKDYFADYELMSQGPGNKGQVPYHVAGINIRVAATLDKQSYSAGDTARLTLVIGDQGSGTGKNLFARVNYNGYEEQKSFTLNNSQALIFDVPLAQITGEKLFYGIYHEGGRSIHLNTLYIHEAGRAFAILTDKQVYDPGETVSVTILGHGAGSQGAMTLTGPGGYSETFAFAGSVSRNIVLASMMSAGTYDISAQLVSSNTATLSASHPIDVNGIQVKIIEANLDKGKYAAQDTIKANLAITSNVDLAATLKAWVLDPQGRKTAAGEQPIVLTSTAPLLLASDYSLLTAVSGIHRLVFEVYSGDMLLSAGAEAFDVGDATLLGITTDKADYPTSTEPVTVSVNMYGTIDAMLELLVDGATLSSAPVALNGYVTLSSLLGEVQPGTHVVKGILTAAGLTSAREVQFIVRQADSTPPVTLISVGVPKYEASGKTFAFRNSVLTLSATDDLSGVAKTEYRIDNGAWTNYAPFSITSEGSHLIEYHSLDNAANVEDIKDLTVWIDNTPPMSELSYAAQERVYAIMAMDSLSGTAGSEYRIDSGIWTPYSVPFSIAVEGAHTIDYRSRDNVTNLEAIRSLSTQVDNTPPTGSLVINAGASSTNTMEATLTMSCVDSMSGCSLMQLSGDNTTWSVPETYAATKAWQLMPGDGPKSVFVKFKDAAGNLSGVYSAGTMLDTTPPMTAASPAGGLYKNAQSVTLSVNEPAAIFYTRNGSLPTTSSTAYAGPILISGTTTLLFFAHDTAGNDEAISGVTFTIDDQPPVLILSMLPDGGITNNATQNVVGTVTDNIAVQGVTINDIAAGVSGEGTFSHVIALTTGTNLITTEAKDTAGNTTLDKRSITLDQQAPLLAVTNPSDNSVTNIQEVMVKGAVDETSTVMVTMNNEGPMPATMEGNTFSLPTILVYMTNTIEVKATDPAMNSITEKRTITYDNVNPSLAVTYPAQDITTTQPGIVLQGTVSDLTALTVTVTHDGTAYTPAVTAGTFQQELTFATEKTYSIVVTASDAAGNTTTLQRNIIYKKASPASTALTYTGATLIAQGRVVTLSGTLKTDDTAAPNPVGRKITFTLGAGFAGLSCIGTTDSHGIAGCSVTPGSLQPGPTTVTVTFAGDAVYQPSSDSKSVIVYAFPEKGAFVIGNRTTAINSSVTFWGAQWRKDNHLSNGAAPAAFKGFADTTGTVSPECGETWITSPGNSASPPDNIPSYMAVMVSSSITKAGSAISGDLLQIVVVKTDPGYGPNPGHNGTGTVIGVLCHTQCHHE